MNCNFNFTLKMSLNTLKASVRQYLSSHHMNVDDDWLSECVEYLCSDSDSIHSETDIKNLAKEQWLLNDLKDICPGSLPENLHNQQKTVLNGRFVLQINAAVDIGTPAYQQYLKLQKVNMENVDATTKYEDKVSSHRMIKLYLTDGVQEISAIEYKPMRNLSCDITPGCKVIIKGPIECRRGILLLTESSIELLGGEVQEIAVSNSLPGLLSSKLGLPVTQEPDLNTTISLPRNTNMPTPHTQMPSSAPDPTLDHTRPVARVTCVQATNFADDDIDIDQLDAIEAQLTNIPGKRPSNANSSNPEKKFKTDNKPEDYPNDDDIFLDEDEDYLKELEANIAAANYAPNLRTDPVSAKNNHKEPVNKGPIAVTSEPFVYIKQINDMSESSKVGRVFKIKGQIMKLLSKLSVGKDGWSLKCTLVDGTGTIDVEFMSAVLSRLVGFTPEEMNSIKKQMATKPELKAKAVCALQKAKDTLQVLYCVIELTILEVPKITNVMPFDSTHVDLIRQRVQASQL